MAEILKVFTPEQLYTLLKAKIIADNVGITDFNEGSVIRSMLEAIALIESTTGFDYLEALRNAIPVALYDGLGFTRKGATRATGYLRFFRLPEFTIEYTGSGSDCLLTITDTHLTTSCTGASGDNLNIAFSVYDTTQKVRDEINGTSNYTCTMVGRGNDDPKDLYHYSGKDIKGAKNYLDGNGFDVMLGSASLVSITSGAQASVDEIYFKTTASGSIPLGESTSDDIAVQAITEGSSGNISAGAIDTLNGKGVLNTPITGVEYVKNDSAFTGGENAESEQERARRFQVFVQGLAGATVKGIESAVLGITGIKSVTIRERYPQPGYITIIADDGTGSLSSSQISEIIKVASGDPNDFENYPGYRAAGILLNVSAPSVVAVDVTMTVTRLSQFSDENEIKNDVKTAIENYINTLKLGDDVICNKIRELAMGAHPAVYDISMSVPSSNVSISDSQIARTGSGTGGSVTITVTT